MKLPLMFYASDTLHLHRCRSILHHHLLSFCYIADFFFIPLHLLNLPCHDNTLLFVFLLLVSPRAQSQFLSSPTSHCEDISLSVIISCKIFYFYISEPDSVYFFTPERACLLPTSLKSTCITVGSGVAVYQLHLFSK